MGRARRFSRTTSRIRCAGSSSTSTSRRFAWTWRSRRPSRSSSSAPRTLPACEGLAFLDDPETVLATLTMPTRVEEPEEELAEGEEAELEGVPEEERPEGAAEGGAEPAAEQGEPGTAEG